MYLPTFCEYVFLFRKVEMTSARADLIMALKETLRYGLFLGTFAGTFVSVDEIIAALGGHRRYGFLSFITFSFECYIYYK